MDLAAALAEALLATRSDAIIAADRDGLIQFWNPGAERLFDHSADEALGRSLDLIIPERLRERHWHGYGSVMATGQSRYGESDVLAVPALRKGRRHHFGRIHHHAAARRNRPAHRACRALARRDQTI